MNPHNWTLRTRLIAVTVALVAATSVVIGGVMFLMVRNQLLTNFDTNLDNSLLRLTHAGGGPGREGPFIDAGTIVAEFPSNGSARTGSIYSSGGAPSALSAAQLSAIVPIASSDGDEHTSVNIPGRGDYRFIVTSAYDASNGVPVAVKLAVGAPLYGLYKQITGFFVLVALVVIAAILLAAIIGAFLLRRAMRPLSRVAAVASTVAGMSLDRGDVHLAQRVPDADTNPHTEVGQVGSALNNLLDSVETALVVRQASEDKVRTFVADASHELRTPLASIRGYAELTRRFGGDLSEEVQHNIARIESEAQRMTSLVEDLLLLARLDAQRELDTSEVDLSRLLVDVLSDAHAAGPDHEWDLELPDEPVTVRGDDLRLHQVFANLLTNARVHTPAGTRVTLELAGPVNDFVEVRVRDTGPGIPEALQPTLFERFVRGDSSRNRRSGSSTGLGLSIVHAVITAHHGTVRVESQPGSTVFIVRLPVHQPEVDTTHSVPAHAAPEPEPAHV
ncbi:MAG TPA: HAMP domain-containing sensor histidine kinase [Amnibacterium sp.]|jgi:two-component system OmpR family sensor kinase|uniref:HAMP domain-containing sensor histidine kinase n=1 Tax=Amnibacterium sp. TaxID=1872496 RepID=UPI002F9314CF